MDRRNALNFRYRLLPQQTSWTNGTATDINLGTLAWGDHKLEVQTRLLTGPWSATASKTFHVLRPIWLSSPALLAFLFIGGASAVGGHQWRRLHKHRANTRLPELAAWRLAVVSPDLNSLEGALLNNRFQVLRIVARGGFATVWEGHDRQQNNRLCAVKVFRHELLDKSWMQKRFQHEVSALTQIHHPNVVRIYGHGTVPSGAPYLAMEFIHGQTLREKLTNARLTVAETASYLRQAASALAEIHAHGVCHRDVKPENLMIRSNGKDLVLIDFSIAIVQDPDETIHGLSRAAGTMHYMAPEQAVGYANESSDIYSLAKILIEMLTGQRLSTLLPDASIDLPDRVRELELGLSPGSTVLLAKALEFDPSRRPKDANAFGEMLATDLEKL
jgi:tRNA A-37 threonylcarbamoyl transferase component Bud32